MLLAFSVLSLSSAPATAQVPDSTPAKTVWVAGDDAIVKIAKDSGEATQWRSDVGDAKALAADCRSGVLWAYDGSALSAYAATGARLFRVHVGRGGFSWYDKDPVDRAALILQQDDGSAWVASGKRAYRFDAQGRQVRMVSVEETVRALGLDTERDHLVVVTRQRIEVFDAQGVAVASIGPRFNRDYRDVVYDRTLDALWVADRSTVYRYDAADGKLELRKQLSGTITGIAPDYQGGLWLAAGRRLIRIDETGDVQVNSTPFREGIVALVSEPVDGSVWVANADVVRQYSASGGLLHDVDVDGDQRRSYSYYDNRFEVTALGICVNLRPVADAGDDFNAVLDRPVRLDGSASYDPEGELITLRWSVIEAPGGNGALLEGTQGPRPRLTPSLAGDYVLELIVNDGNSDSEPSRVTVSVGQDTVAPNARAGRDQPALTGARVTLDGSASDDPNGLPLSYAWTLTQVPAGSTVTDASIEHADMAMAEMVPDVDGTYTFNLHIGNGALSDDDEVQVTAGAPNVAPVADPGVVKAANTGESLTLDASASYDPDNAPQALGHTWSLVARPAGSELTSEDIVDADTATPSLVPDIEGAFIARLKVSDGAASDAANVLAYGDDIPPQILITSPDGSLVTSRRPDFIVSFTDWESEIDPQRFSAELNGTDISSHFTVTAFGASYTPAEEIEPGHYTFDATIGDLAGNSASATSSFQTSLLRVNPTASVTTGYAPLSVFFTTDAEDPDGTVQVFRWDFDGNGSWDTYDTVAQDKQHIYTTPGVYQATLQAQSSTGSIAEASIPINVLNNPPTASANVIPSNGGIPLDVDLIGSGNDVDGTIVLYEWDFDGDGTFDYSDPDTGTTTHRYSSVGTYPAVFRVTDDTGNTASASVVTTAVRAGPAGSPTASATATPDQGDAPLVVNFSGTGTDPQNDIVLYEWDFDGDGVYDYADASSADASHTYTQGGTHVASLRVSDGEGKSGIDQILIRVNLQAGLSVSPNSIGWLSGANTDPKPAPTGTTITTTLSAGTTVSVSIRNEAGATVRALVENQARDAGTYQDPWDALDDNGVAVRDGLYYALLDYRLDGETLTLDLSRTTGGNRFNPPRQSTGGSTSRPRQFSPFDDDPLPINFSLSKASEVTLFAGLLYTTDLRLRTMLNREPMPAGSHTVYWDGLDDQGNLAEPPPGNYIILGIWGYDLPANALLMSGGAPEISNIAASPNYFSPFSERCEPSTGEGEGITLGFELSGPAAAVELRVYGTESGALLRSIDVGALPSGSNTILWDGKNDAGEYVDIGDYQLGVIASDSQGNQSMLRYTLVRIDY